MLSSETLLPTPEYIGKRIIWLRGEKVLLDADLAKMYGVSTTRLNEQVKRNADRFPSDFAFRLTNHEFRTLISQIATSNKLRGGARKNPVAFTEHGALMAASVLKLEELERKTEKLSLSQDAFAAETREQFKQLVNALRQLMAPPAAKSKPIGFVTPP